MIKNIIISILIVTMTALSSYTLWSSYGIVPANYPILLNAGIGLLSILFLFWRFGHRFLAFIWIIMQLVVVELNFWLIFDLGFAGLGEVKLDTLNMIQYFGYLPDGASVQFGDYLIRFNVLPIAYLLILFIPLPSGGGAAATSGSKGTNQSGGGGVARALPVRSGEIFDVKLFRVNEYMERILPQKVKIVQQIDFRDSKNWFVVRLSKPIKYKNGQVINSALIKPKEGKTFVRNQPGQLAYFRLIPAGQRPDLSNTRFIDWIIIR